MGILMFVQTIMLIEWGHNFMSTKFKDSYDVSMDEGNAGNEIDIYMETCIFLQISNSSAILILSARTVGFFFSSFPAWQLLLSTAIGQVIVNAWVFFATWQRTRHARSCGTIGTYGHCAYLGI